MKTNFFLIIFCLILVSCDLFEKNEKIIGRYYIINSQYDNYKTLAYKVDNNKDFINLIRVNVRAAGYDKDYIIIEQDTLRYYIVPIYKEYTYNPEKGILGPLNLNDFNLKKKERNINVGFSLFPDK